MCEPFDPRRLSSEERKKVLLEVCKLMLEHNKNFQKQLEELLQNAEETFEERHDLEIYEDDPARAE